MSKWVGRQLAQGRPDVEVGQCAVCAGSTGCRSGSTGSLGRVNRMSKWVSVQFAQGQPDVEVGRRAVWGGS